ncbi:MAG: glycosyltransferase [Acidobacteria bacterium]|nr:glycosyltransferase [Acidobacteriota bacterium]
MEFPRCSILVVNYNGKRHLDRCLSSFERLDYPSDRVEILLIDNGSEDDSENAARAGHPRVKLIRNPVNGYAAALNLGIARSEGDYVAFANNDVFADPAWLSVLVRSLETDPRAGCAGGKILFENGRINSAGHRALPDYYWEDEGYDQEDRGQYDSPREVEGLCWAAVLFRRKCLEDIGPLDEDYVFYCEDVDTSLRCRKRGWKILYAPDAVARHVFHGSGNGAPLAEHFCDRGRLIYVAKYHPGDLATVLQTSRFLQRGEPEALYETLPAVIKKLAENHSQDTVEKALARISEVLVRIYGTLGLDNLLARMQVILGHRRMSVGLYDQALHVIGGGQKYGCTIASVLQDHFDVTLVSNKPVDIESLEKWYRLPLSKCRLEVIPLPFFDQYGAWIDSNVVNENTPNPFDAVSLRSLGFDVFINVNMLAMVRPLSPFSIFICHFPDTPRRCYFSAHEYSHMIANSRYTAYWTKVLWDLDPDRILYPPVQMESPGRRRKENIILSAARFEPGGSKKQAELIEAFEALCSAGKDLFRDWRLVLAGGSLPRNPYLESIEKMAQKCPFRVEVRTNIPFTELQDLYAGAKIFWHACGLGEKEPRLVEHFGMTTVEAMQNGCVPVVIDGGGQREIVEHGQCGYRFNNLDDLIGFTLKLVESPGLMERMGAAARQKGRYFSRDHFEKSLREYFQQLRKEYGALPVPDPRAIMEKRFPAGRFHSPAARAARSRPSIKQGNG